MQETPHYKDVVAEVRGFLDERVRALLSGGFVAARILIDPGFGFGKTLEHNLALFRALGQFVGGRYPVLAGLSRKSMLGAITGRPAPERVSASVAAALLAVQHGVQFVRVHDVAATRDAIAVWEAIEGRSADA
jgi:dihydropteroate synthase